MIDVAEATYNLGRAVGWSTYEEFLKETGADSNVITSYIYSTMVTYGVTRVVELQPGEGSGAWISTHGGQFYRQTIQVPGATWGAVPIVGLDYNFYLGTFAEPDSSTQEMEQIDALEKEAIESAVGNIFAVYVSDEDGNRAVSSVSPSGYLTFMAYPDILAFNRDVLGVTGGVLKLIVRGLSLKDLDVDSLYFGPQGLLFAGNGLSTDSYHETRDINNLSLNSAGYLWLSVGGNSFPVDYRGLVDHPSGQILISTFGYIDLDFINGTGRFSDIGTYGLTYTEYLEALQSIPVISTQVDAIPLAERDTDYVYLVSGLPSYDAYPTLAHPFYIIPVHKETGKVNIGSYDTFEMPKMKKIIDFTRLHSIDQSGGVTDVLYLYDKQLPDYMGNWWGGTTPESAGLSYEGNNTLLYTWITADLLTEYSGTSFSQNGRHACWKFTAETAFRKGHTYLISSQVSVASGAESDGVYLCTRDVAHGDTGSQLNRFGSYVDEEIPSWVKEKQQTEDFCFTMSLPSSDYSISNGVLSIKGTPVYPGEVAVLGTGPEGGEWGFYYVWNTISSNQINLILSTLTRPTVELDSTASANIMVVNPDDAHSNVIKVPRSSWDASLSGRSLTVFSDATTSSSVTTSNAEVTLGSFVILKHQKTGVYGYDKYYIYVVLSQDSNYIELASAMVWVDNPTLTATAGYPGTYDAIVPRYNQNIPNSLGSYYYNMNQVLSKTTARKMFSDCGWDIADYVDEDFQNISLGEFLQECVVHNDLSVSKSPETNRASGLSSTFNLYSKQDLGYATGVIVGTMPEPTEENPIYSSIRLNASTTAASFFETALYSATMITQDPDPTETPVDINNPDYPIWVTVAKSKGGNQTFSVSTIDGNGIQLNLSGNEGSLAADNITWLDLLTALGTGQTLDILKGFKFRKSQDDSDYILTSDGTRLYLDAAAPSGTDIPDGSFGIGW